MGIRTDTGLDVKRLSINMIFSIIAFGINTCISFFITPYLTANFGAEAYGFVKLASDFADYASLLTVALNSMASRFIMLKREQGDTSGARKYYSSITIANTILAIFLMIPSCICVFFLENMLEIPVGLLHEVKMVFSLTFLNFILNLLFTVWGCCYYLTNRLDISSVRVAQSNIIKVGTILCLLYVATPKISFVVWGTLTSTIFVILCNGYYKNKLTPELSFSIKDFEIKRVWEVLSSGIWNSITKLSQIFSSGLDLLITNLLLGSANMGYLSVAKTVPNLIASFNSTIASLFSPNLMQLYAKGEMEQLKVATKTAMRFMCLFVTLPNAILITIGVEFFQLWVPEQPAHLINVLSILTVLNSCVTGPTQPLYQIFTITNKVKQSSIVLIIYGFISVVATYICLLTTNFGVYAVAGVSLIGSVIVALGYHIPFSAVYIGLPWYTFFPEVGKGIISLFSTCAIGWGINMMFDLGQSWITWICGAGFTAIVGLVLNVCLVLNKSEIQILLKKITNRR